MAQIDKSGDLAVTYRDVATLKPRARNPRTHSKKQIRQIAESIETFGFTNPVLIDRDGGVVAGHGRLEAAKLLGLEQVPTIALEDLSEAQIRAYVLADNRLAELAGWHEKLLGLELQGLLELDLRALDTSTRIAAAGWPICARCAPRMAVRSRLSSCARFVARPSCSRR